MQSTLTFTLTISKVNERVFHGEAVSATFPGSEGEFTVLTHHEPLITLLAPGIIIVRTQDETLEFAIEKGVFEASHGQVTVLI
jgi:F-type H+-transporting ATPase subunit epsilon